MSACRSWLDSLNLRQTDEKLIKPKKFRTIRNTPVRPTRFIVCSRLRQLPLHIAADMCIKNVYSYNMSSYSYTFHAACMYICTPRLSVDLPACMPSSRLVLASDILTPIQWPFFSGQFLKNDLARAARRRYTARVWCIDEERQHTMGGKFTSACWTRTFVYRVPIYSSVYICLAAITSTRI